MKTTLIIDGMTCGMCVKHVEEAIASVPEVSDVHVNLEQGSATFNLGAGSIEKIIDAIKEEGYQAKEA